ncbi:huntingtin-interacting protein 1-like isoform X2 [Apostichopus japonicus]|uniref:huntingtin-interacting protein 1-like isoform X2 n=1 Tax=Stichopus japonicus TaxID=307972 RepID=UPI003AB6C8AA
MMSKLSVRRSTDSLEAERQSFVKQQTTSINKAINGQENPAKEKHVRRVIMGTFQEKGMSTFWTLATRTPLQGNQVSCWKFCHTLHKLLQQGHEKVLPEAQKHLRFISDLGKMWTHLQEGYGKLNSIYCQLLLTKLEFHQKYPTIPGNLQLTDPETALEKIAENDINNLFQMSVEIFDYLDALINLEEAIFGSFDLSKNISTTASGQCRLAPLIPVVVDSGQLYDFSVRLLYKLHACLPQDTLSGHRQRFLKQFEALKAFYTKTSTLIYFKHYIQVPSLPKSPPNFFVKANSEATYITQAVMLDLLEGDSGRDSPQASREPSLFEEPIIYPPAAPQPVQAQRENDIFGSPNLLVDLTSPKSNGQVQRSPATPPPLPVRHVPDERDRLIEQLRLEIESLKFELERTKMEDQRIIEMLKRRLMEMEMEMNEHQTVIETQCQENEDLRAEVTQLAMAGSAIASSQERVQELEAKARSNEDKFQKMKEVYQSIRDEHVNLLRKHADVTKQLGKVQKTTEEQEMARLNAERFVERLQQSVEEKNAKEETIKNEAVSQRKALLVDAINSAQSSLRRTMEDMDDPSYATATCTAEYLLSRSAGVDDALRHLEESIRRYEQNDMEVGNFIASIGTFSNILGSYLMKGKATSNMAPVDKGESLSNACHDACHRAIDLVITLQESTGTGRFVNQRNQVNQHLKEISRVAELLHSGEGDISEELGDLVDKEMQSTTDAILQAEKRIEDMLRKSQEADSGVKLEVNGRILDSCTELMKYIKALIENSKNLQREIVSTGKGSATSKDFYKRHHRWTEGLISAAKLVGVGATHLVDASDKVVQGKEKFEALIVCSSEIAACTAQLVAASRVKSDKGSANLKELQVASKGVASATAKVVASAKTGAEMIDEKESMDFTNLSLTQTKRLEMESKIRVLELENNLEKERKKLDELRKVHYQLAGSSEGWDEDEEDQYGAIGGRSAPSQGPNNGRNPETYGVGGITEYV